LSEICSFAYLPEDAMKKLEQRLAEAEGRLELLLLWNAALIEVIATSPQSRKHLQARLAALLQNLKLADMKDRNTGSFREEARNAMLADIVGLQATLERVAKQ